MNDNDVLKEAASVLGAKILSGPKLAYMVFDTEITAAWAIEDIENRDKARFKAWSNFDKALKTT